MANREREDNPVNSLLHDIAKRAKFLGNERIRELRATAGYNCETESAAISANKYLNRGELIEYILLEEFGQAADDIDGLFHAYKDEHDSDQQSSDTH